MRFLQLAEDPFDPPYVEPAYGTRRHEEIASRPWRILFPVGRNEQVVYIVTAWGEILKDYEIGDV